MAYMSLCDCCYAVQPQHDGASAACSASAAAGLLQAWHWLDALQLVYQHQEQMGYRRS
jgi:hypothetical protein